MRITVIGATGMVGSRVTGEAAQRGHLVTAVSRGSSCGARGSLRGHASLPSPGAVTAVAADAGDRNAVRELLAGSDAVVLSVRAIPGEEEALPEVTATVLDTAVESGIRVVVVGGAGPLRSPGDANLLVVDDPDYVPEQWRAVAEASVAQLRTCEKYPATNWTYLSPPAILEPGTRTGTYRRGTDTLLTTSDGSSHISVEDFAVAVLDELENPSVGTRLTVAY